MKQALSHCSIVTLRRLSRVVRTLCAYIQAFRSPSTHLLNCFFIVSLKVSCVGVSTYGSEYGYGEMLAMAVSRDGTTFVTGGTKGAYLWSLGAHEPEHLQFETDNPLVFRAAAVSGSGRDAVVAMAGHELITEDFGLRWGPGLAVLFRGTGLPVYWRTESSIGAIALAANSVVIGGSDGLRVYDMSGNVSYVLNTSLSSITSLDVSSDGKRCVAAVGGRVIEIWDLEQQKLLQSLQTVGWAPVETVKFSPDGLRLLSTGDQRTSDDYGIVTLWDAQTGARIRLFGEAIRAKSVAFSPDGSKILAGVLERLGEIQGRNSSRPIVKMWDADSGDLLRECEGHFDVVHSLAFVHDGTQILTAGSDQRVFLWDVETGRMVDSYDGHFRPATHPRPVDSWRPLRVGPFLVGAAVAVGVNRDSSGVWSNDFAFSLGVWDAGTGDFIRRSEAVSTGDSEVVTFNFSPDESLVTVYLFAEESDRPEEVLSWNVASGRLVDLHFDPRLNAQIELQQAGVQLQWINNYNNGLGATLQFSNSLDGPWIDLPGASPVPLEPIGEKGFFRVKGNAVSP